MHSAGSIPRRAANERSWIDRVRRVLGPHRALVRVVEHREGVAVVGMSGVELQLPDLAGARCLTH